MGYTWVTWGDAFFELSMIKQAQVTRYGPLGYDPEGGAGVWTRRPLKIHKI